MWHGLLKTTSSATSHHNFKQFNKKEHTKTNLALQAVNASDSRKRTSLTNAENQLYFATAAAGLIQLLADLCC